MGETPVPEDVPAVTVYWRPGCGFCSMLRRTLRDVGLPLEEHDIWQDPDAAAFVRSVNRGNETVPTVVVGGRVLTNPRAEQVVRIVDDLLGGGEVASTA